MCIDSEGRLYVTAGDTGYSGIQSRRKVPWHHSSAKVRFERGVFRTQQEGALREGRRHDGPGRQRVQNSRGVRNNAKAIYKIDMIAQGFTGRAK